jgi:hypothetical protein
MGMDDILKEIPVWEEFDLAVTAQTLTNHKTFERATRIIFHMDFVAANLLFSVFAGEAAALTNGIMFRYNDRNILTTPIRKNNDLYHISYDVDIASDATAPKINTIVSRLSFFKFMPNGLELKSEDNFEIVIQDDLSGLVAGTEVKAILQGYNLETREADNKKFPKGVKVNPALRLVRK